MRTALPGGTLICAMSSFHASFSDRLHHGQYPQSSGPKVQVSHQCLSHDYYTRPNARRNVQIQYLN